VGSALVAAGREPDRSRSDGSSDPRPGRDPGPARAPGL